MIVLIVDAAKAAYLATVIRYKYPKLEKYEDVAQEKELVIDAAYVKVGKLKKSNPAAFFYWYQLSLIRK